VKINVIFVTLIDTTLELDCNRGERGTYHLDKEISDSWGWKMNILEHIDIPTNYLLIYDQQFSINE